MGNHRVQGLGRCRLCSPAAVRLRPGSALSSRVTLGKLLNLRLPQSPDL